MPPNNWLPHAEALRTLDCSQATLNTLIRLGKVKRRLSADSAKREYDVTGAAGWRRYKKPERKAPCSE